MTSKKQFKNLVLQEELQDFELYTRQQSTAILPIITLPMRVKSLITSVVPLTPDPVNDPLLSDVSKPEASAIESVQGDFPAIFLPEQQALARRKKWLRVIAVAVCLVLVTLLILVWRTTTSTSASPTITQQNLDTTSSGLNTNITPVSSMIQVYVLGAVVHPGVYTLPSDARVYQLLQAAGGPLADADLVALDLAAKVSDGQEIYVLKVGEVPPPDSNAATATVGNPSNSPSVSGQTVNINTATSARLMQVLHVSSVTAQKIITYRTQHGPYTSVDQLLQVVSKTIYTRIKTLVTV